MNIDNIGVTYSSYGSSQSLNFEEYRLLLPFFLRKIVISNWDKLERRILKSLLFFPNILLNPQSKR